MSYVDKNLMSDEVVVHRAKMHWFAYVPSIFLIISGLILVSVGYLNGGASLVGMFFIILGLYKFISVLVLIKTTELVVTSKRVIAKTGFIRRNAIELNHSKVESYNINQSVFGRLFGYGTLEVNGTGGGITPVPGIDGPMEFRRKAMEVTDAA